MTKHILARTLSLLMLLVFFGAQSFAATFKPLDVSEFLVEPNSEATFRFEILSQEGEKPETVDSQTLRVLDARGNVRELPKTVRHEEETVTVTLTLPQGYWELVFGEDRFGIVALPKCDEKLDAFFAIDGALSWLVQDDTLREGIVKLARKSGIGMVRERFRLSSLAKAPGVFDWEANNRYETLRKTYKKHGVEIQELFHDAPAWMGKTKVYPKDLNAFADAAGKIAERWEPYWGAIEVWNEPDIFFGGNLPADQYVAVVKAFSYRMREDGRNTPIIGGVVAHHHEDWLAAAKASNLLDIVDIFSFHTYDRAPSMERLIGRFRDYSPLPLWLTECGRPWKKGPDRPPLEQDFESVTDIIMKGVESKCCGVERYFPFVLPYYEENDNNFGMLDRSGTPLRSFAGYAQMIRTLAHTDYLGDLKPECYELVDAESRSNIQRARVFKKASGEAILVLYTGEMKPLRLKTRFPVTKIESVLGEPLPLDKGTMTVTDGLVYVFCDQIEERMIEKNTEAMRLLTLAKKSYDNKASQIMRHSPVVAVYDYDEDNITPDSAGYRATKKIDKPLPMAMRVYNLSRETHEFLIEERANGPSFFMRESRFSLPGGEMRRILNEAYLQPFEETEFYHFDTNVHSPEAIQCMSLKFFTEPSLEGQLKKHPNAKALPISKERWSKNVPGGAKLEIEGENHGVRFSVEFGEGDKWCYPNLSLPEEFRLTHEGGFLARVRCTGETTVRMFLFEEGSGSGYLSEDARISCPADGQWHVFHVPIRAFHYNASTPPDPDGALDLEKVKRISIGFNTQSQTATLEIDALYFYEK